MEHRYSAIIVAKKDVGETDRIYTLYTEEAGKIQALAEGVRKPQAKLAGHLENFTLASISVVKKRRLGKITSSTVENNFPNLRSNFDALTDVFRAVRIFDRLVQTEEKDRPVFNLLRQYLEAMNAAAQKEIFELLSQGFIFQLLDLLGYKIHVSACVSCGNKLSQDSNYFSAEEGGIVCGLCAPKLKNKIRISGNTIKIIRIFLSNNIKSLAKLKVNEDELGNLKLISQQFVDWIIK